MCLPGNIPPEDLRSGPAVFDSTSPPPGGPSIESSREKRGRDSTVGRDDFNFFSRIILAFWVFSWVTRTRKMGIF